jgi:hypothetical protein
MPFCRNHPEAETCLVCSHCGGSFCQSCLVEFLGQCHCGGCRDARLAQLAQPPSPRKMTRSEFLFAAALPGTIFFFLMLLVLLMDRY